MQRGPSRAALPHTSPATPSFVHPETNRVAQRSGGFIGVSYGRFMRMPVAVVLTVMWLGGMALFSACVLLLFALGTLLASVVAGA